MSKERLKEILNHKDDADSSSDEYEYEKVNFYNLHVEWLIEQAKRVHEGHLTGLEELYANCNQTVASKTGDIQKLEQQNKQYRDDLRPIPAKCWREDDGYVIWWRLPVEEPPYVGSPQCYDWIEDYYTHFTRLIIPLESESEWVKKN